jgi:2-dehydro-3-deoxy-L-rhamnonate dehydrogenase (NAD+)
LLSARREAAGASLPGVRDRRGMTERRTMFLELPGRVALVTGAARGIGFAIAERLSRAGASVVVADIDEKGATEAVDRLRERGGKTAVAVADITDPEEVGAMVERTLEDFGQLDILVNNAGITGRGAPLWETTDEEWEKVLELNLSATFYCCRAVVSHMRERRGGAIVNVASISGKEGNPNMIPYSVSKAGVICLTKALAKEVIQDNVRVNCVAPGVIETPLLDQLQPEAIEYMRSKVPMGRMGRAEEVAAVVHFLASDEASFVTGQCYDVSGGRATY